MLKRANHGQQVSSVPWGTMDMAQMFSSVAKFGDKDIISVNGSASAPSIKC